jgi:osmotically-inducible protein OsmY
MDRVTMASPPGEHRDTEGPGSAEHYRSDAQLTEEIEDMLEESDEVNSEHIDVFVQSGNVTLRGSVKTPQERELAVRTASEALGVGEIRAELDLEE